MGEVEKLGGVENETIAHRRNSRRSLLRSAYFPFSVFRFCSPFSASSSVVSRFRGALWGRCVQVVFALQAPPVPAPVPFRILHFGFRISQLCVP